MPSRDNIFIYVADALRADYWPDLPGTTVETACQGSYTYRNFPTMLSGAFPERHRGEFHRFFGGQGDPGIEIPSLLDLDQRGYDVSLLDHPNDPLYTVFNYPPRTPLADLTEPFVAVYRQMATHTVYGRNWESHGGAFKREGQAAKVYDDGLDQDGYTDRIEAGELDHREEYAKGVSHAVDRFEAFVDELADRGVLEGTQVVFTADHGECFADGEDPPCPGRRFHAKQCRHVMEVRTTFYGEDRDVEGPIRSVDLPGLLVEDWPTIQRDLTVRTEPHHRPDPTETEERLQALGYL